MKAQVACAAQWSAFSGGVKTTMVFVNQGEKGQECSERERAGWHSGMLLVSHSWQINTTECLYHACGFVELRESRTEKVFFLTFLTMLSGIFHLIVWNNYKTCHRIDVILQK